MIVLLEENKTYMDDAYVNKAGEKVYRAEEKFSFSKIKRKIINWDRMWPPKLEKAGNFLSTLTRSNSCFRFFKHYNVAYLLINFFLVNLNIYLYM